jgi:hypothetical protein
MKGIIIRTIRILMVSSPIILTSMFAKASPTGNPKTNAGAHGDSATPPAAEEQICAGNWQSVDTSEPGAFSLRLSTAKGGRQRLEWPNSDRDVLILAAHRAKGPADPAGKIEVCSRGAVVTNDNNSILLRDLATKLKLPAGYYVVNVRFQVGTKVSNSVAIQIK